MAFDNNPQGSEVAPPAGGEQVPINVTAASLEQPPAPPAVDGVQDAGQAGQEQIDEAAQAVETAEVQGAEVVPPPPLAETPPPTVGEEHINLAQNQGNMAGLEGGIGLPEPAIPDTAPVIGEGVTPAPIGERIVPAPVEPAVAPLPPPAEPAVAPPADIAPPPPPSPGLSFTEPPPAEAPAPAPEPLASPPLSPAVPEVAGPTREQLEIRYAEADAKYRAAVEDLRGEFARSATSIDQKSQTVQELYDVSKQIHDEIDAKFPPAITSSPTEATDTAQPGEMAA